MNKFFQEGTQLLIVADSGTVIWKGNPKNWSVAKVVEIPNADAAIVLLDYYKWDKSRGFNLICVNSQGETIWEASEKSGQLSGELITDIQLMDGCYLVNTWNGSRLSIDETDGRMIFLSFTR